MKLANVTNCISQLVTRRQSKRLNITGFRPDTADETLASMVGGWLVDLAAFPETRPDVEHWMCEAYQRGFEHVRDDAAESAKWYAIAEQLSQVLDLSAYANFARTVMQQEKEDRPS